MYKLIPHNCFPTFHWISQLDSLPNFFTQFIERDFFFFPLSIFMIISLCPPITHTITVIGIKNSKSPKRMIDQRDIYYYFVWAKRNMKIMDFFLLQWHKAHLPPLWLNIFNYLIPLECIERVNLDFLVSLDRRICYFFLRLVPLFPVLKAKSEVLGSSATSDVEGILFLEQLFHDFASSVSRGSISGWIKGTFLQIRITLEIGM